LTARFSRAALDAAATQHEVTLTTTGRRTGEAHKVTVWIATDGNRIYVRSGGGMERDWPQNLMARGEGTIHLGGETIRVKPRHVTDPDEARKTSQLARDKYGGYVKPSRPNESLTKGESAAFELIPI
jgi:deazaflavin-dependent oxidoreductase (nitroreductase family)